MAIGAFTVTVTHIKIDGAALNAVLSSSEVQETVDECADDALSMMKKLAPVDTGRLSRSLEKRKVGNGRQVGSWLDYAAAVELGHRQGSTWVPGQPYIRPAIDAARAVMKKKGK